MIILEPLVLKGGRKLNVRAVQKLLQKLMQEVNAYCYTFFAVNFSLSVSFFNQVNYTVIITVTISKPILRQSVRNQISSLPVSLSEIAEISSHTEDNPTARVAKLKFQNILGYPGKSQEILGNLRRSWKFIFSLWLLYLQLNRLKLKM